MSSVPPRFVLRSTGIPVRASICCASNSASTTCSVKNFDPTTSFFCGLCLQPEKKLPSASSDRAATIVRRKLRHLQLSFEEPQRCIRQQRQKRRGNCSRQNNGVAHHRDSPKNERPKPTRANGRGNRRHANRDYRRRSNARQNHA